MHISAPSGDQVPLSAVARYEFTNTPLSVNHQGQFAASTISFSLPEGVSLSAATAVIDDTMARIGMPASIYGGFQGTARSFQATLARQPWLILAAIVAMYIVLGILYESFVLPITILSTLPSAGVGALLALSAFGAEFSVIALIGVFLLIGLVKKNAIMMVDFAIHAERNEDKRPADAIHEACSLRFRPIMMTTMAALLGALPLALGRRRRRTAPAARHRDRRRIDPEPASDAVYDARCVPLSRPVPPLVQAQAAPGRRCPRIGAAMNPAALAPVVSALLAAGCMVGPDYVRPPVDVPAAYKEMEGWKPAEPRDALDRGSWWEIFGDPELNALARRVDISNQNIRLAEANFRQARAVADQARAGLFPTVSAGATATRSKSPSLAESIRISQTARSITSTWWQTPTGSSTYGAGCAVGIESGEANWQASAADLESVRLSAQATLVQTYIALRVADVQRKGCSRTRSRPTSARFS